METRKVLIYRNELLPPSETFILSQANALRRFQPIFVGLKRVSSGLEIATHPVLTLSNAESWMEKAKRRIFLRTGHANQFIRAVVAQRPRIMHAHFAVDAGAALPIAKKLSTPLVVTLHGYDVTIDENENRWPTTKAYLRNKRRLWSDASVFICVSEHVRKQALACGFPEKKLWVHHIGVDLSECGSPKPPRDKKDVLFVGRLVEKKGCIHLIRAMSRVQQVMPDSRLIIIGDGPLRNELKRAAARHCKDAVFFGQQSHAEVKRWMRHSGILVVPSIRAKNGDSEGLPTVLCEAQALGLPPITFATGGVTEALPAERRYCMPSEEDEAGLAEKIIHLLRDDRTWQLASDAGRQYVKCHFDILAQTRALEDKYEEIIASHDG